MGEREFQNCTGLIVDDCGRTFALSEPAELYNAIMECE